MKNLLDLARDIIDNNNSYKSNHLTFITRRTTIIAVGKNYEDRSHTVAARWGYIDARIHSEVDAILKASRQDGVKLRYCKLWNVRINRLGRIVLSKPCKRCANVINSVGIREVYYTNTVGEFETNV